VLAQETSTDLIALLTPLVRLTGLVVRGEWSDGWGRVGMEWNARGGREKTMPHF